jgi:hypothetical protein
MITVSEYTKLEIEQTKEQNKLSGLILSALQENNLTLEDLEVATKIVEGIFFSYATLVASGKGKNPLDEF